MTIVTDFDKLVTLGADQITAEFVDATNAEDWDRAKTAFQALYAFWSQQADGQFWRPADHPYGDGSGMESNRIRTICYNAIDNYYTNR